MPQPNVIPFAIDVADLTEAANTLSAGVNLVAFGVTRAPAVRIEVIDHGMGTLIIKTDAGTERTLTVNRGQSIDCAVEEIVAGTNALHVRVYWSASN